MSSESRPHLVLVLLALALPLALLVAPPSARADDPGPDWGVVTGTLVDTGGAPLRLGFAATSGAQRRTAATEADGQFWLQLPPGPWRLTFAEDDAAFVTRTLDVTVTERGTTELGTVTLAARATVTFDGVVRSSGGDPLAGADVELLRLEGSPGRFTGADPVASAVTDAAGRYELAGLPQQAGRWYTVAAYAAGHRDGVLGGGSDPLAGTPLESDTDRTAAPLELRRAPSVHGTVRGPDGAPLPGVDVQLWRWDASLDGFVPVTAAPSRSAGAYSIPFVGSGHYTLWFETTGSAATAAVAEPGWLAGGAPPAGPGSPGVFSFDEDAPADVTRDRTLAAPPYASGRLVDAAGRGLAGVAVDVLLWDGLWFSPLLTPVTSAADGTFRVRLPRGAVVSLSFTGPGDRVHHLGGGTEIPEEPTGDNSLTVAGDVDLGTLLDGVPTTGPTPTEEPSPTDLPSPTPQPTPTVAPTVAPPTPAGTPTPVGTPSPSPTSSAPTAVPTAAPTAVPTPPLAASTVRLRVQGKGRKVRLRITVRMAAGGSTTGLVQVRAGRVVLASGRLRAGAATTAKVTLAISAKRLARLPGARKKLRAHFGGNARTAASTSRQVVLRP
ncbi:carboxypeptidase-like regulatory domain-containing protein [Nocardioides solisilvae]|uniref:carboxypeptidase-like regulatory domain-containing protein n=1 Tax=Nocardioides solisilvae TaxID=1542435 RepID=UPI000D74ED7D|nr:carboxypeptidase-like regulatory domain-containing protein [Nocardioides solisilvae]